PAADLQDLLAAPPLELGEAGEVRLHEILPLLDLVEIFAGARLARRVAHVAGPAIPKRPHVIEGRSRLLVSVHACTHRFWRRYRRARGSFAIPPVRVKRPAAGRRAS